MALTPHKLRQLRERPVGKSGNRVADAIELSGETQVAIGAACGFTPTYVNDVARGRYESISLSNGRAFADHFGCELDDLFPAKQERRVPA